MKIRQSVGPHSYTALQSRRDSLYYYCRDCHLVETAMSYAQISNKTMHDLAVKLCSSTSSVPSQTLDHSFRRSDDSGEFLGHPGDVMSSTAGYQ